MSFDNEFPRWEGEVSEPTEQKKTDGWQVGERPPAGWLNWLFNKIFKAGQETQQELSSHKSDNTPHLDANETHNWGFRVNADKSVTMLFEEV